MKKIIVSAVGLMLAGGIVATTAAAAVESQFGGYWRTRMFIQDNFDGQDSGSDYRADNRTRLYYTAKFSDDFKFVNKFEFNSIWGDKVGGDIGADGNTFVVKNSYADFNLANFNVKLGIQGYNVARGFLFDDDFSGAIVTGKFGNVSVPLWYASVRSDAGWGVESDVDEDIFGVLPSIKISDVLKVNPYLVWHTRSSEETDSIYVGADVDMTIDSIKAWGTFIYNGGEVRDQDIAAFLVAGGVDAGLVHGRAFYASGDDGTDPSETEAFQLLPGRSYYWSEIMGLGVFDNRASNGSPGDRITNIAAFNAGVTVKPMDKLKLDFDVWYAFLAEENAAGDDELGLEFDGKATYALMDNLNAELILAYLVSGDATGDEDVMEGGVRISLSF